HGGRGARRKLRVRARISWHFGASAGQADARRRDAGDVLTSSRSGNAADTRLSPPRPAGLRLPRPANHCGLPVMIQLGMGAAAKCQIILARALSVLVVLACLARMCGMPTDNSYAGEMPQSDRVKGDRSSQDNAAHPPPDYSSCLPPRKGAIRRDPTYGRTIKRLTDSPKPGPGKP